MILFCINIHVALHAFQVHSLRVTWCNLRTKFMTSRRFSQLRINLLSFAFIFIFHLNFIAAEKEIYWGNKKKMSLKKKKKASGKSLKNFWEWTSLLKALKAFVSSWLTRLFVLNDVMTEMPQDSVLHKRFICRLTYQPTFRAKFSQEKRKDLSEKFINPIQIFLQPTSKHETCC